MLKHFILFTFEENFFNEAVYEEYCHAFNSIMKAFEGIKEVHIYQNCIDRPANMDIMVEMLLENEDVLSAYLTYPEHLRMSRKYNSHIVNRVSFDYTV